jgi:chromosome segregation ATPase
VRASEQALDAARGELQKMRSRAQSLEEIQARYRGCASGVQLIMQHREQLGVLGILADQLSAPARLEAALSSVLGDRLQGVLVTAPSGRRGRGGAAEAEAGGAHALPAARGPGAGGGRGPRWCRRSPGTCPRGRRGAWDRWWAGDLAGGALGAGRRAAAAGVLGRLVDLIEVPAEYRGAGAARCSAETLVVETLGQALRCGSRGVPGADGDARGRRVEASGVVVGGSAKGLDAALLQQKREIRELHAQAETRGAALEAAREAHSALLDRQSLLDAEREHSEQYLLEAEKQKLMRAQEVTRLQQEMKGLQQRIEQIAGSATSWPRASAAAATTASA